MSNPLQKSIQKAVRAAKNDVPHVRRAKINLAKKRTKRAQTEAIDARQNREDYATRIDGMMRQYRKEARQHYKDDWELGLLAPRRDVGKHANTYGAIDANAYRLPERQPDDWKPWCPIAEGDRVVVIKGRERGKIGVVEEVDAKREAVTIKDINRHYVILPNAMQKEREQELMQYPRAVPLQDVRLVHMIFNPRGGHFDRVIDKLVHVPMPKKPFTGNAASTTAREIFERDQARGLRVVYGADIAIPWPATPVPEPEFHEKSDTSAVVRDRVTFKPTLLHMPMPLTVIDELRNKYGKFRRRPPGEAQARVAELEAKKEARVARATALMTTPRQALADLKAKKGEEAKAERELNVQQLAKIGELVIQARQRAEGKEVRTS